MLQVLQAGSAGKVPGIPTPNTSPVLEGQEWLGQVAEESQSPAVAFYLKQFLKRTLRSQEYNRA